MAEHTVTYQGRNWTVEAESRDGAKLSLLLDLSRFLDGEQLVQECSKLFAEDKPRKARKWGKGRLHNIPLQCGADMKTKDFWTDERKAYKRKYHKAYNSVRRATRIQRTPAWADLEQIKEVYNQCPEGYHVDHIIPLQGERVSGLHVAENLQYLPATENIQKGNKFAA